MKYFVILLLFILNSLAFSSYASEPNYWSGPVKVDANRLNSYTSTMHTRFNDISENYQQNGIYFYSGLINSFGMKEVLDPSQQPIFCSPNDRSFTEAFFIAAFNARQDQHTEDSTNAIQASKDMLINFDSTNFGVDPFAVDEEIRNALINNSNAGTKGRFCYDINDYANKVNYRQAGAEQETFCGQGASFNYADDISGFSCSLALDAPLKVGETRFVRQLQNANSLTSTVGQGLLGCYQNEVTGRSEVSLLDNPDSCSSDNRQSCIRSCDWADNVVCDPRDMPNWGLLGQCAGIGTVIFKNDILEVNSNNGLSYNPITEETFGGTATMACQSLGGNSVEWIIVSQTCNKI